MREFFLEFFRREKNFGLFIAAGFLAVGGTYEYASVARWIGFAFAAYAAVANDSIQTIGTFIASNRQQKWWVLWLFIGGIFLATVTYSFITNSGDVSYGRLQSKGFDYTPTEFSFLQVAAPLCLLILTRLRMPVSTTFLLLTSFATSVGSIGNVLAKSLVGYAVAFGVAMLVWLLLSKFFERWFVGEASPGWRVAQWVTSGILWSVWIMQDAANIAVYLPRQLQLIEFIAFALIVFIGLGLLLRSGGERIQEIVDEKSSVIDVRPATIIDLVYTIILYYFKAVSQIPMSTTWVFLGLLGGREVAMSLRGSTQRNWWQAFKLMGRDALGASIGLLISLLIAYFVNPAFRKTLWGQI
ncbi:MAG: hypothetical protein KTR25_04260 [Myxococcales bacterium]|nr:hypothetical protein [Myxococcales bacterium]